MRHKKSKISRNRDWNLAKADFYIIFNLFICILRNPITCGTVPKSKSSVWIREIFVQNSMKRSVASDRLKTNLLKYDGALFIFEAELCTSLNGRKHWFFSLLCACRICRVLSALLNHYSRIIGDDEKNQIINKERGIFFLKVQ